MKPRRIVLGLLVVSLWVGAMLLLYERERGGEVVSGDPPVDEAVRSEPFRATYAVLAEDRAGARRVGSVEMERRPETRHGVDGELSRVDGEAPLRLRGEVRDFRVDGAIWRPYDPSLAEVPLSQVPLAEVDFRMRWQNGEIRLRAALRDGALRGEVTADGETRPIDVPVPDDVLIESGVGANVGLSQSFSRHLMRLEPGESLRFTSFDPLTLGKSTARATCLEAKGGSEGGGPEDVGPAKHFEIRQGALETRIRLDAAGELMSATTPLGLRLERVDEREEGDA